MATGLVYATERPSVNGMAMPVMPTANEVSKSFLILLRSFSNPAITIKIVAANYVTPVNAIDALNM